MQIIQNKERIFRAAKKNGQVTYKGRPIRITLNISKEIIKARKSWTDVLQTLRDHRHKLRLLYPAKFSITIDGKKSNIP